MQKFSKNIDECTVWQFKNVQMKKDLRYLLLDVDYSNLPETDEGELVEAWEQIQEQWSDIIGGERSGLSLLKHKRLVSMKQMLSYHQQLYNAIAIFPLPELINLFNQDGFKVDLGNFAESMKVAKSKLEKKKAQIETQEPKTEVKGVDFDAIIVGLERAQGYGFNEKEMSVRKLANIYKLVKEDGKRRENKKR